MAKTNILLKVWLIHKLSSLKYVTFLFQVLYTSKKIVTKDFMTKQNNDTDANE